MIIRIIYLTALLSSLYLAGDSCANGSNNFYCVNCIETIDADTVTFDISNIHPLLDKNVKDRAKGVDAPEIKTKNNCEKKKGNHAKYIVTKLLKKAKRIELKNIKRGSFFRIVADIIIDGTSLSDYLLKNGLAYSYDGKKKKKVN